MGMKAIRLAPEAVPGRIRLTMAKREPPLTPAETLRRVLRTARIDGLSVLVVSGVFTLWSLAERDWTEAGIGLLICAAGAIELRGRARLVAADPRGLDWLIASQVWLLLVAESYFLWRLQTYDPEMIRHYAVPMLRSAAVSPLLAAADLTEADLLRDLRSVYTTSYLIAALLFFLIQGGLILRYRRARPAVSAALGLALPPA
jgi:hypothetical protein